MRIPHNRKNTFVFVQHIPQDSIRPQRTTSPECPFSTAGVQHLYTPIHRSHAVTPHMVYNTWIPQFKYVTHNENLLYIEVPSRAFVEVMWKEIGSVINHAVHTVFGEKCELHCCLPKDTSNERSGQVSVPSGNRPVPDSTGKVTHTVRQPEAPKMAPINSYLNPNYTFENFIEGRSNRPARTMAESIADNPHQKTFNPMFLYGPSGVGKSHLVNAIGVRIQERFPNLRVLFVAASVFRTQYTDSVRDNTINDFIHFYQTIDVLIIDDFQEITTAKTQNAFFHIFNHLHQNNHKIIITCDRPPSQFEGIEERMLTRLKWGVVVEIERPDLKLRRDILKSYMKRYDIEMPENVLQYIANNVSDNVREIEGTVNSLIAFSLNDNCDIDLELVRRVVARLVGQSRKELTMEAIMNAVCEKFHVKPRDISGKSRRKDFVAARQILMYLLKKYTPLSICQIGRDLGGRDHSTVIHACNMAERRLATDKAFRLDMEKFEAGLKRQ